jgi:UDP-2-acetamido-2-deoxy-ribo-hexuluronate aminotransferase
LEERLDFIDLKTQYQRYKTEIHDAIDEVMTNAAFIKGPALDQFEDELRRHSGSTHAIGCSSGTDALLLGMMALGVKPGDEVLVPDFTFFATAEMVRLMGAVPVFVDIDEVTYNMDPAHIAEHIGDKTVGIMPVSLYGQCADLDAINEIASNKGLWVLEDAAQSYGATYKGRTSCTLSLVAATSFFPAKPLGCYGDGGAVFTCDDELARRIRVYLNHGQERRYYHSQIGINGRLDSLQAAILSVKLRHFDEEMAAKRQVAAWYTERLSGRVKTPRVLEHNQSVWAQYTIRVPNRESVQAKLKDKGIPTAVHYPLPLHQQPALADLGGTDKEYPVATRASAEVMSLPMHPFMTEADAETVANAVLGALGG